MIGLWSQVWCGVVSYGFNLCTWEAEVAESLEFEDSQGYVGKPCFRGK